jgi:tRNA1Val (adenine37-N6)-methyltransferase
LEADRYIMKAQAFTYEYSQPSEYHFCQDSVLAPKLIAEDLPAQLAADFKVLDVCAGCGVFGFELQFHRPEIAQIDFLEIQSVFREHFDRNAEIVRDCRSKNDNRNPASFRFLDGCYTSLKNTAEKYDLVIGNPPYFQIEDGSPTADPVKTRARFFQDASFDDLINGVLNTLKPNGHAYLLVKSGEKHARDPMTTIRSLAWNRDVTIVGDVRGTNLIRIS